MAKFTFIFSLLTLSLQTQLFPVEARKFTITNNCSYTVWPGSNIGISEFSLQTQESADFEFTNNSLRLWGKTNCTTSTTTGIFVCQTGDCGSGKTSCNGPPATTLMEFSVNLIDGGDYYDVSLVNGYHIPVAVVPVGANESQCAVTGCMIYDKCPLELVLADTCQSPCRVFNTSVYCCYSPDRCQPTNYSKFFKKACPRAFSYPFDDVGNTFSCRASTNFTITFCPTSTTLISELSKPFQSSNASAPSSSPGPAKERPSLPSSPRPTASASSSSPGPAKERPSLPSSPRPTGDSTKKKKPRIPISVVVGVPTSIAILILLCFGTWICMKQRKARERYYAEIEEIKNMESLQFDINAIRAATGNFSEDNKLGEGGFGEVYKGKLESGQEVAVKRLLQNSKQGAAEFKTEVVLVAKLQHINLVKLLGFCVTSKEKILVYELLPNSSLDRLLFDSSSNAFLDWQTRLNIIIGIARGLLYLHEDSRLKVIHRDLKTSNILLDEAMNPKISDFGLAKLFGEGQTQGDTKRIVGTYGYMAPEYAITGHYSVKSDVYSFGVMVLEIISGKKNRFSCGLQLEEALLHQAWRLWNERKSLDLVDRKLNDDFPQEEVTRCFHVGLLCIQEDATQRPRMRLILDALTRPFISLPEPKPPRFFGDPNNLDQDHQTVPHSYSGTEMITDLYPRD